MALQKHKPTVPVVPLWELIAQLLPEHDAETEWWTLAEIAPLLGIKRRALAKHARDLWPEAEGHWRLKYSQAISLIRRVVYAGRKLPSRASLERKIKTKKERN
jgi:hypothetical protein